MLGDLVSSENQEGRLWETLKLKRDMFVALPPRQEWRKTYLFTSECVQERQVAFNKVFCFAEYVIFVWLEASSPKHTWMSVLSWDSLEEWTVKRFRAWGAWQIITGLVWEFGERWVCVGVCVRMSFARFSVDDHYRVTAGVWDRGRGPEESSIIGCPIEIVPVKCVSERDRKRKYSIVFPFGRHPCSACLCF